MLPASSPDKTEATANGAWESTGEQGEHVAAKPVQLCLLAQSGCGQSDAQASDLEEASKDAGDEHRGYLAGDSTRNSLSSIKRCKFLLNDRTKPLIPIYTRDCFLGCECQDVGLGMLQALCTQ